MIDMDTYAKKRFSLNRLVSEVWHIIPQSSFDALNILYKTWLIILK